VPQKKYHTPIETIPQVIDSRFTGVKDLRNNSIGKGPIEAHARILVEKVKPARKETVQVSLQERPGIVLVEIFPMIQAQSARDTGDSKIERLATAFETRLTLNQLHQPGRTTPRCGKEKNVGKIAWTMPIGKRSHNERR
jgi:hypothetical protein